MPDPQGYATFEQDGVTISSNTQTVEELEKAFKAPEKPAGEADETTEAPDHQTGAELPAEPRKPAEKPLGKPRDDPKARMLQATQQLAQTKREKDEIERRYRETQERLDKILNAKPPEPKAEEPPKKSAPPSDRPKLDDFDSIEDHAEAVAKWAIKKEREEAQKAHREQAYQEFTRKRVDGFQERMKGVLEADPEFWNRQNPNVVGLRPLSIMAPNEPKGPLNALAEHFLVSEQAPALIEYFSGNPDELNRFSQFKSEGQFWYELGKVEKALVAAPTASAKVAQISKAAPPARPVTGGPPTKTGPSVEDDDETYFKKRTAEELRKLSR